MGQLRPKPVNKRDMRVFRLFPVPSFENLSLVLYRGYIGKCIIKSFTYFSSNTLFLLFPFKR